MTCVAYGSFDAIHRGHLKIAKMVAETAVKKGLRSVIVSGLDETDYLTSKKEKEYLLSQTGIDEVLIRNGRESLQTLIQALDIKVLVLGENHAEIEQVKKIAEDAGIEVLLCPVEKEEDKEITNELVRNAFEKGDFREVGKLCNHPYIMIGEVEHGKGLGKTAGMPTANLAVERGKQKPPSGVYATRGEIDGKIYKAVTNIGRRPSVDSEKRITIETFFLDFDKDLYEKEIRIEILQFIRDTRKFENLEQVSLQIRKDIEVAYSIF